MAIDCNGILRKYSRYLLILFNFYFVITGVILVAVGATARANYHIYSGFLENKYFYVSDLLIAIGTIIFVIAFFGCCGALKENACMTLTFSIMLIIVFILEVIVGIGGVLLKHKAEDMIDRTLNTTIKEYGGNNTEVNVMWDAVQTNFDCCGIHSASDWVTATNSTQGLLPLTCCTFPPGTYGNVSCTLTSSWLNRRACLNEFTDYIEGHAVSIQSAGLGLGIIQLLGTILACYLSRQIRSDYETV